MGRRLWQKKDVSQKFTSLKWEVKNTYFIMPARRIFGGPARRLFFAVFLADLSAGCVADCRV
jgi:hypothetical protein